MPISVKTAVYEGPLDLLLELIEKRKLLINDISLASVTDEYIAKVNAAEELPLGEMAEFIALAATLLLIKSRSLLPTLELSEDEGRDIKELQYRLALYQIIRDASRTLLGTPVRAVLLPGTAPEQEPQFLPDETTLDMALASARSLIDGFPKSLTLPRVEVKKIISIEEVIERLTQRVSNAMHLSFKEFTSSHLGSAAPARGDIIVSFLAMLELVKQGIIRATQEESGDITLQSDSVSTPSYQTYG